jgi:hypothetical protein
MAHSPTARGRKADDCIAVMEDIAAALFSWKAARQRTRTNSVVLEKKEKELRLERPLRCIVVTAVH